MKTKGIIALGLLAVSNIALSAGWEGDYKITEYLIEGAENGERMYVGFDQSLNPDSCQGEGYLMRVFGNTEKGKYLFSIILSAHASQQSVSPKLEGCDDRGRPLLTGLRVAPN